MSSLRYTPVRWGSAADCGEGRIEGRHWPVTEQLKPNLDIVIDCADPETLAAFWAEALGYRAVGYREPYFLLLPTEPAYPPMILQRVPEPKRGKARVHVDLRVDNVPAEVRRLEALGARRVDVGQGDDVEWVPMSDPEGNEFCVCPGAPVDV
jgi:catechol 2,3-dioxygenase-like lactoylglutathione lyase family enzyme